MKRLIFLILALPIAAPIFCNQVALAGLLGPSTYDECVLDNMKGVTSDLAAKAIIQSCRNRFPSTPKATISSRQLSDDEANKITGRAGLSGGTGSKSIFDTGNYSATFYNGNPDMTITKVIIWVSTTIDGKPSAKRYAADVIIPPQKTVNTSFNVILGDQGAEYSWNINTAFGY